MEPTPPNALNSQSDILSDSQQNGGRSKKKIVRFSAGEDILLLREVLSDNPFEGPGRWDAIAARMRGVSPKDFNKRNCKERTEYLVKMFKKGEREVLKKSGTKEEYSEREHLLEETRDLQESTFPLSRGKRSKSEAHKEEGKRLRLASAEEGIKIEVQNNEYSSPPDQMSHSQHSLPLPSSSPPPSPLVTISLHKPSNSSDKLQPSSSPSILSASCEPDNEVPPSVCEVIPRTPLRPPSNKPSRPLPSPVPTSSKKLIIINSATPYAASSQRKAALNKVVMEHMSKKHEVQSKTIELELLKAQNENMRLNLELRKQSMLVDAQEKKMMEFEKKIDSLLEIQMQNAFSLEKKIEKIYENQNKLLSLFSTIVHQ